MFDHTACWETKLRAQHYRFIPVSKQVCGTVSMLAPLLRPPVLLTLLAALKAGSGPSRLVCPPAFMLIP